MLRVFIGMVTFLFFSFFFWRRVIDVQEWIRFEGFRTESNTVVNFNRFEEVCGREGLESRGLASLRRPGTGIFFFLVN